MTLWTAVLLASAGAFALKVLGYLVPDHLTKHPHFVHVAAVLPIGLLSGLIAVQTVGNGGELTFDGRIPGLVVAIVLLLRKAQFIVVVIAAAAVTATGRALGWWA